jgi:phage baseplate assembly protein W
LRREDLTVNVDFPLRFDGRGRTAETDDEGHVRDMIEQLLFTAPGERVNRPTFGSGALALVFAPNGDALAAAMRLSVQASLQEWLGDLIEVASVDVDNDDATLRLTVRYVVRRTGEARTVTLVR